MKYICGSLQDLTDKVRTITNNNPDVKLNFKETDSNFTVEMQAKDDETNVLQIDKISKLFSNDRETIKIDKELFVESVTAGTFSMLFKKLIKN